MRRRLLVAKRAARTHRRARWLGLLCLVVLMAHAPGALAQDAPSCEDVIAEAESEYFAARFDEAIQMLDRCLAQGAFDAQEREEAYSLLGRVYFAKGLEDKAAEMVQELLTLVPNYRPNPAQETPDFVAFVDRVRESFEAAAPEPETEAQPTEVAEDQPSETPEEPADEAAEPEEPIVQPPPEPTPTAEEQPPRERRSLTKWLLIGGGAVVTGVVAALLLSGDSSTPSSPTTLPPPPAHPAR